MKQFCNVLVLVYLLLGLPSLFFGCIAQADIKEQDAIRAVIGEASDQGYQGMLAVSCAIRNRGSLQGVYGLKAKHVDRQPQWVWDSARKAWNDSALKDVTHGADHWGGTKIDGKWIAQLEKSMKLVYEYKDQKFYARLSK